MDVVSACPLRVASLVRQARPGSWVLTVVCKATFRLAPDISPLAAQQEDPNEDDNHWDDNTAGELDPYLDGPLSVPAGTPLPWPQAASTEEDAALNTGRWW